MHVLNEIRICGAKHLKLTVIHVCSVTSEYYGLQVQVFKFKIYFIATISNRNSNNIQEANHMEWKQWEDLKGSKSR